MATLQIGDVPVAGEPTEATINEAVAALARNEAEFLIVVRDEATGRRLSTIRITNILKDAR